MLQKGQISKATDEPCTLHSALSHLLPDLQQETVWPWSVKAETAEGMWHKPTQNTNWRLAVQESWHAIPWLRNSAQNFWDLYSTFHIVLPCNHSHHNQSISSNCSIRYVLHTLGSSLPTKKTSLSPAKLLFCQNRGCLPLNRHLAPNTDRLYSKSTNPAVLHSPIQSVLRHFTPSSSAVDTAVLVGSHGHFCFLEMWISVRRKVN